MIIFTQETSLPVNLLSVAKADDGNDTPTSSVTMSILVAECSIQGFGPDWLTFVEGDLVKVIDRYASGWLKVQRISDDAIGVGPSNYFVSAPDLCWVNTSYPSLTQQYSPPPRSPTSLSPSAYEGEEVPDFPDTVIMLEALYDFQGVVPDDLSCAAGDIVRVLHRNQDGWWKVHRISDSAIGVVPTNYFVSRSSQSIGYMFLIQRFPETIRSITFI